MKRIHIWRIFSSLLTLTLCLALCGVADAGGKKRWQKWRPQRPYYHEPLLRNLPRGTVINSRIKRVEVYVGRALIEREAQVTFKPGSHRLVFPALPWLIDASTLNISGFGADTVAGSTFLEEGTMVEARPRELRQLEAALKKVEYREQTLANQASILEGERTILMKSLSQSAPAGGQASALSTTLHFARSELGRITTKLTTVSRKRAALSPQLAQLRKARALLLRQMQRRVRHVVVEVRARKACKLGLKIRYVVRGPTWRPRHEGRYDPGARRLRLETFAWVVQQTGEAWEDVKIQVGNARPTSGLMPPAPRDRRLTLQSAGARVAGVTSRLREVATQASGATSNNVRLFRPGGKVTIPSGPQGRRVRIASAQLTAKPRHVATPVEHPGVFLKLALKNQAREALLAGEAALFNGQDYVGTARLPQVLPGEQLVLPFGRDSGVTVARERIRREHKVTGARQTLGITYQFSVANKLGYAIDLELREVLPRPARQQRLRVTMQRGQPAPRKGPRGSLPGLRLWDLQVAAGGTSKWRWSYQVTAPAGKRIVGVD